LSQSRHHSWQTPESATSPQELAGVSAARGGLSKPLTEGRSLPHGKRAPSSPPRAAFSHSASLGSRKWPACSLVSHSQYTDASNQLTPTTACSGSAKRGSSHQGGGGTSAASRKRAY